MWENARSVQVVIDMTEPVLAKQTYVKETERDGSKEKSLPADFCLESC